MKKYILSFLLTINIIALLSILYIKNIIPKEIFLPIICKNISNLLNTNVTAKDISINIFKGITLIDVKFNNKIKNTKYNLFYDIKHITLKYNFIKSLKQKNICWDSVFFYNPKINIITKPKKILFLKTSKKIFNNADKNISLFLIDIIKKSLASFTMQNIRITKGELLYKDFNVSNLNGNIFLNNISKKSNINLTGNYLNNSISIFCSIDTKSNQKPISIEIKSNIIKASGLILYTCPKINILSLIYRTKNSRFFIKGLINLQNKKISLTSISNLSLSDINFNLPNMIDLKGYLNLSGTIEGSLDNVSSIIMKGKLTNNLISINDIKLNLLNSNFIFSKKILEINNINCITENNDNFSGFVILNNKTKKNLRANLNGNINLNLYKKNKLFNKFSYILNKNNLIKKSHFNYRADLKIDNNDLTINKLNLFDKEMHINSYGSYEDINKKLKFKIKNG